MLSLLSKVSSLLCASKFVAARIVAYIPGSLSEGAIRGSYWVRGDNCLCAWSAGNRGCALYNSQCFGGFVEDCWYSGPANTKLCGNTGNSPCDGESSLCPTYVDYTCQ